MVVEREREREREEEREFECVCVTEIGRDRECSLNIYFLISMVCLLGGGAHSQSVNELGQPSACPTISHNYI